MKKIKLTLLVCIIAYFFVGGAKTEDTSIKKGVKKEIKYQTSTVLLNSIWDSYPQAKKFSIVGGDYDNLMDNEPGECDSNNDEMLNNILFIPKCLKDDIKDVASMIHANDFTLFTCGAFQIKNPEEIVDFGNKYKDYLSCKKWRYKKPKKMSFYQIGERYIVFLLGDEKYLYTFEEILQKKHPESKKILKENI